MLCVLRGRVQLLDASVHGSLQDAELAYLSGDLHKVCVCL